jgi:hypothetical protein
MRDEEDEKDSSSSSINNNMKSTQLVDIVASHIPPSEIAHASPSNKTPKWKPVLLPLDQDFLRLNTDEYCDEFAVMLQNEEFLAELRFNQEFLSSLERESEYGSFEERLKHMGKVSRKKFQQLAKIFTFQRKKNAALKPKSKLLEQESEDEQEAKGSSSK